MTGLGAKAIPVEGVCLECHDPIHAGRCWATIYDGKDRVGHEPGYGFCPCKEESHGTDSPASGDSRGLPVAGLPVDRAAAQQRLATLEGELAAGAEDVLARIGEIGQTMTDGAERWKGAS